MNENQFPKLKYLPIQVFNEHEKKVEYVNSLGQYFPFSVYELSLYIFHNWENFNENNENNLPCPLLKRNYSYYGCEKFDPKIDHQNRIIQSIYFNNTLFTKEQILEAMHYIPKDDRLYMVLNQSFVNSNIKNKL
jgi:hypothetical protein